MRKNNKLPNKENSRKIIMAEISISRKKIKWQKMFIPEI